MSVYLTGRHPRVIAHRGYSRDTFGRDIDENTIEAFASALEQGADLIESDIQVTSDGVAVLLHDDDLARVAGIPNRISELTFQQIGELRLSHGGRISSLLEVLNHFPTARFNLDFKTANSVGPGVAAIAAANAQSRILVASFSEGNRRKALKLLPGAVSSAGMSRFLALYICMTLGLLFLAKGLARDIVALQIPIRAGILRFDTRKFIAGAHRIGLEVHFWTINESTEISRLLGLGADGIVTDETPMARSVLGK